MAQQALTDLATAITNSADNGEAIKQELKQLYFPTAEQQTANSDTITTTFSQLNLTQSTKAHKFREGDKFTRKG